MKDIELKPCPFCGGEAELNKSFTNNWSAYVMCSDCSARTALFVQSIDWCANDEAVKAWNRRVSDKEKGSRSAATEQEPDAVDTALNE